MSERLRDIATLLDMMARGETRRSKKTLAEAAARLLADANEAGRRECST